MRAFFECASILRLERPDIDSSGQTLRMRETQPSSSRMKRTVRSLRPGTRFLSIVAFLVIVGATQTGCKRSQVAAGSIERQPEMARQAGTSTSSPPVPRLVCPALGSSGVPSGLPSQAGHRVVLSWRASAPADAKHLATVGYCIYRGTGWDGPPTELLNHFPFSGNKCADDLVENGKKYYYLVRAISDKGVSSIASGPVRAAIPNGPRTNSSVSADSTPLCREPASVK
jgi:hypothetical protein